MDSEYPTVPCSTCGTPTPQLGTKLCDPCWEVQYRLEDYLKNEGGRRHVFALFKKMDRAIRYSANYQHAQKARGLCSLCPKPIFKGGRCKTHWDANLKYRRELYAAKKARK